jgi:hypothetical protein
MQMFLAIALAATGSQDILLRRDLKQTQADKYTFKVSINIKTLLPSGLGQDESRVSVSGLLELTPSPLTGSGLPLTLKYAISQGSAGGLVGAGFEERGGLKTGSIKGKMDVLGRFTPSASDPKTFAELAESFLPVPLGVWPSFPTSRVSEGSEWRLTLPDIDYAFVNATVLEVKGNTAFVEIKGSYSEDVMMQVFVLRSKDPVQSTEISKFSGEFEIDIRSGRVQKGSGTVETRSDAKSSEGFELVSNRTVTFAFEHQ